MSAVYAAREWLTLPQVGDLLGLSAGKVSRLVQERHLLSLRIDGEPRVPADFLKDGEPVPGLRGTLILLFDAGLSDDEIMTWLLTDDDALGAAPVDALREGRKTQVRHSVQLLAI
ncbi:DNA-binding protein [Pseudoclavibacter endophyticus]|uniref:DNA-binding protein n=1 Tax=Pseudoclavibacter endophyticus TaxID=1778590 RepID=A0A6H9WVM4_9MICO|nr:DNA-binding protein [Pseudoclavibacter endophyticus]